MKKSKIITLAILVIMFVSLSIYLYKSNHNPVVLDEVILKQEISNDSFAMYKEEGEGYTEVEGPKFPEGYVLNITESKCIDNNGNEINNALSYENDIVVLKSNKSSYCYLYFDKSLGLEIKEKKPNKLSEDIKGAMYRFQGQAKDENNNELVDNYICFGTSDKNTCVNDTDHYMYRIIGIEASTGRVKVIKKEALKDQIAWADNYGDDIKFPDSKIYEAINGDKFLTNTDYVPKGWKEKISDNTWIYGDMWEDNPLGAQQTGKGLYETETGQKETMWNTYATQDTLNALSQNILDPDSPAIGKTVYYIVESGNWTNTFDSKISLIYLHDYYYSVSDEAICQFNEGTYPICQTGWMHSSQNNNYNPSEKEWTMSRVGWWPYDGAFSGICINSTGGTCSGHLNIALAVRPVFYINASEELLDGEGTLEKPFIIN